jgi:Multiubiquitin
MAEEKKSVTIYVEGTPHEWPKDEKITYEQVVLWVYPDYSPTDGRTYTGKYKKGDNEKPEGQLVKGASVKVKDGMIFSVSRTGQS